MAVPDLFRGPPPEEDEDEDTMDFLQMVNAIENTIEVKFEIGPTSGPTPWFVLNNDGSYGTNPIPPSPFPQTLWTPDAERPGIYNWKGLMPMCARCGVSVERLVMMRDEANRKHLFRAYCHGEEDSAWIGDRQWVGMGFDRNEQEAVFRMRPFAKRQIEGG